MMELNCQTDFVAKSKDFYSIASFLTGQIHEFQDEYVDFRDKNSLLRMQLIRQKFMLKEVASGGDKVSQQIKQILIDLINKTQENCKIGRIFHRQVSNLQYVVGGYVHREVGQNIGGISCASVGYLSIYQTFILQQFIKLQKPAKDIEQERKDRIKLFANQLATHITGMQPFFTQNQYGLLNEQQKTKQIKYQYGPQSTLKSKQKEFKKKRILQEQQFLYDSSISVGKLSKQYLSQFIQVAQAINKLSKEVKLKLKCEDYVLIMCE